MIGRRISDPGRSLVVGRSEDLREGAAGVGEFECGLRGGGGGEDGEVGAGAEGGGPVLAGVVGLAEGGGEFFVDLGMGLVVVK
jgi:hypothetical protein